VNVTDISSRGATPLDVREWQLETADANRVETVRAQLLGATSSERERHTHSEPYTPPGWKCSACRWIEIKILKTEYDTYLVHTVGHTTVPGETKRVTLDETDSPDEVVELLVLRRQRRVYMPTPSARALAAASAHDDALRDAYRDRAVA